VSVHPYNDQPHFWIGRMSKAITLAVADLRLHRENVAREHLQDLIRDFLRSPVASDELRATLRDDLRHQRRH